MPVLATLIWLIYSSLSRTAVTIFQYAPLDNSPPLWLYDGNVEYLGREHAALFVAGLLIVMFLAPYTVLLAFLPFFQAKSHLRLLSWVNKMKPLLDSYQAPYKDSYRYWTGVILLARFALYLFMAINKSNDFKLTLIAVVFVSVVLFLTTTVLSIYKYWPLSLLDAFLYFNIAVVSFVIISNDGPSPSSNVIIVVGIFGAFIYFIGILMINLWAVHKRSVKSIFSFICNSHFNRNQVEDSLNEDKKLFYREPLNI